MPPSLVCMVETRSQFTLSWNLDREGLWSSLRTDEPRDLVNVLLRPYSKIKPPFARVQGWSFNGPAACSSPSIRSTTG